MQGLLLERMHDAAFATDLENRVTVWSGSAERLFGYSSDEALGRAFGDLLPFEMAAPESQDDLLSTIRAGRSWRGEGSVRLRDGTDLWIESTVSPIVVDGRLIGSVSVSRDMTRQRRDAEARAAAERALRESDEQFHEAFEYASIGMALVGLDGRWLKVNPALVRLLGYSEAELLDCRFQDITHPDDLDADLASARALMAGVVPSYGKDKRYIRRDRSVVHARLSVSLARGADGTPRYFVTQIADRSAEVELAIEAQVRMALAECLRQVPSGASLEVSAQTICDELGRLDWIDFVAVEAVVDEDDIVVLACHAPAGSPIRPGLHLPVAEARRIRTLATAGPWSEFTGTASTDAFAGAPEVGLKALAYEPIGNGSPASGVLVVGTCADDFARMLVERRPGMAGFSAAASALLAERIHERHSESELRRKLEQVLSARAFHPVFQPIVRLRGGAVLGYEALSRFDSGEQPDRLFADAWRVGLGAELELALLAEALKEARLLPAGLWLDLNISPRLLLEPDRLRAVLTAADRPIVLEITEHEPIADYQAVRDAVASIGRVRLAVDDAGAGVANFAHIIELRPDFVKLDFGLVRGVDSSIGRQALVVAMRHFALASGCHLVAEGVETRAEADTLLALGVEFAQGFLFGRPTRVRALVASGGAAGTGAAGGRRSARGAAR